MAETPWISPFKITPEPDKDYIAVITYLPITSYFKFPEFFRDVRTVQEQIHKAHGVIGFKMRADILSKKTYTLSVWEDAKSLKNFMTSGAHGEVMAKNPDYLGSDRKFATVFLKGSEYPPSWNWALENLRRS